MTATLETSGHRLKGWQALAGAVVAVKRRLRDIVIILPGITGSVLQRRGRDIWAPSHRLAARVAWRPAQGAAALTLGPDDMDEVVATNLVPDAHMVGGLIKIDGYTSLIQGIVNNFHVVRASASQKHPANLIEFPYDWRLDNRINARRLADVVWLALDRWRRYADIPDARAILVGHSMGGLVARYFLEVLGGWECCRALISLGTPFRGSLDAVGYLVNGYKKINVDLTEAMRSFPSAYQLMPIYPALLTAGGYCRVADVSSLHNVDPKLVADGLAFHREIEAAIAANNVMDPNRYALLPVVGTHQPTYQSAVLDGGVLSLDYALPEGVDQFFGDGGTDGDGTVPISSAAPIDLSNVYTDVYQAEKHSSLQRNGHVLRNLIGKLAKMQARELYKLRGPEPSPDSFEAPALTVAIDDEFHRSEPVQITATVVGAEPPEQVIASIETLFSGEIDRVTLRRNASHWTATLGGIAPGAYRLTVTADGCSPTPAPVHDIFQVMS